MNYRMNEELASLSFFVFFQSNTYFSLAATHLIFDLLASAVFALLL